MEISKFLLQSAIKKKTKLNKFNQPTATKFSPPQIHHLPIFCCSARCCFESNFSLNSSHRLDLIHHFNYYLKIITTNLPPYIIKLTNNLYFRERFPPKVSSTYDHLQLSPAQLSSPPLVTKKKKPINTCLILNQMLHARNDLLVSSNQLLAKS